MTVVPNWPTGMSDRVMSALRERQLRLSSLPGFTRLIEIIWRQHNECNTIIYTIDILRFL